jgi:thioredoxin reductase
MSGNSALASTIASLLSANEPMAVNDRTIVKVVKDSDHESSMTIYFDDGSSRRESFLTYRPHTELNTPHFAAQLGCDFTPAGDYKVESPFNEMTVKGVFVIGDAGMPVKSVVGAVAIGIAYAVGDGGLRRNVRVCAIVA